MSKKIKTPPDRTAFQRDAQAAFALLRATERDVAATAAKAKSAADRIEASLRALQPRASQPATRDDLTAQLADFRAIERSCQARLGRLAKARDSLNDSVAGVASLPD
jgi:uncharacterized membrane protein YccC